MSLIVHGILNCLSPSHDCLGELLLSAGLSQSSISLQAENKGKSGRMGQDLPSVFSKLDPS